MTRKARAVWILVYRSPRTQQIRGGFTAGRTG